MTDAEYFATGEPLEREVYLAVTGALEGLQPLAVEFVSVGIFFKRAGTFAQLRPKRDRQRRLRVELYLYMSRPLHDERFAHTWNGQGRRSAGVVHLHDARDVDNQVREWLVESYLSSPD